MPYQLNCPCGAKHLVTNSQAGQKLDCTCGKSLDIPTLRGLKDLPVVDQLDSEGKRAIDDPDRRRPSLMIGAMFAIIFLAIPTAVFFAYQRLAMDTSLSEQSDRSAAFTQIDASTPAELSSIWYEFSTVSLGTPSKPTFYYVQSTARRRERNAAIAVAVAVLAGIVAAGISVARRESKPVAG